MTVIDLIGLTMLVLTSYLVTNLDNLLILVFLLGNSSHSRATILLGFMTAVILVIIISSMGVALGMLIKPSLIGYLGFAPIAIGCYLLYKRQKPQIAGSTTSPGEFAGKGQVWFATSILMFSNSADSIAVLLPLLAESNRSSLLLIISIYLLTSLGWCALSVSIAQRPELASRIKHHGEKLVPWVMIAAGLYILLDTGTDTLV